MDAAGALGPLSACAVPPVAPARAPRLRPEAVTGAGRDRHQGQPCHQPGRDLWSGHRRTLAGVLQSGQAWSRWAAGRIRSDGSSRNGPRSPESQHLWSPGAVSDQHGTCTFATGSWLAGQSETPPQHAPPARAGQGCRKARCSRPWPVLTCGASGRCSPHHPSHGHSPRPRL